MLKVAFHRTQVIYGHVPHAGEWILPIIFANEQTTYNDILEAEIIKFDKLTPPCTMAVKVISLKFSDMFVNGKRISIGGNRRIEYDIGDIVFL
jgi:hypothetical protein